MNPAALVHLARRFSGSWSRRPPPLGDLAWVATILNPGELELWRRFGPADQRHTVRVARGTAAALPVDRRADRPVLAAALLHDIGKLDAGLGTLGRTIATMWAIGRGPVAATGTGRIARYLRHEEIGAEWLARLGSDPLTVALVGGDRLLDPAAAAALWTADDAG